MKTSKQKRSIRKSQTHSFALPNIKKLGNSRYQKMHSSRDQIKHPQHTSFISKLNEITPNVQYDYIQNNVINQQQQKLKNLLREFNQQSFGIMKFYMHKVKNLTSKKQKPPSTTSILQISKRQIENNNHVMQICQKQIANLEQKCQNLKYLSVQEFQKKISELYQQIQAIKLENKQINKSNTLRGLNMVKQKDKLGIARDLQYNKFLLENKKQKLETDNQCVNRQIQTYKQKDIKIAKEFEDIHFIFQAAMKQQDEKMNSLKKLDDIKQKQKNINTSKSKNTNQDNKYQHRYFQILKQIEQSVKKGKKIEDDINSAENQLQNSKKQIQNLQQRMSSKFPQQKQIVILKDHK